MPGYADSLSGPGVARGALPAAVDGIVHHLYQALGFATDYLNTVLVARYNVGVISPFNASCQSTVTCGGTWSDRYRRVIRSDSARTAARNHFNDQTLSAVELESAPSTPAAESRLHPRVYNGEVMTWPPYLSNAQYNAGTKRWVFPTTNPLLGPMRKSVLSLAILEDMGWYLADSSAADLLLWGRNLGASFSQGACPAWPASAVGTYVCPIVGGTTQFDTTKSDTAMCSFDRTQKGYCKFKTYSSPIPSPYRYFVTSGGSPDTTRGGLSALLDYCPMNVVEPSTLAYDGVYNPTGEYKYLTIHLPVSMLFVLCAPACSSGPCIRLLFLMFFLTLRVASPPSPHRLRLPHGAPHRLPLRRHL